MEEDDAVLLGLELARARQERKQRQVDWAVHFNVTRSTLADWETKGVPVSRHQQVRKFLADPPDIFVDAVDDLSHSEENRAPSTPSTPRTMGDKELAAEVVRVRTTRGLRQQDAADQLDVPRGTLADWEKRGVPNKAAESVRKWIDSDAKVPPRLPDLAMLDISGRADTELGRLANAHAPLVFDPAVLSREPKPGYLYIVSTDKPSHFKVGRTADLQHRLHNARTYHPGAAYLYSMHTLDYVALERIAHGQLQQYHVDGEIFSAPGDVLVFYCIRAHAALNRLLCHELK